MTRTLHDFRGLAVRMTAERMNHIRLHPEMVGVEREIERTLQDPSVVVR